MADDELVQRLLDEISPEDVEAPAIDPLINDYETLSIIGGYAEENEFYVHVDQIPQIVLGELYRLLDEDETNPKYIGPPLTNTELGILHRIEEIEGWLE